MARIEEKRKENLSSIIWTWIVVGVLGAVTLTGLVLGIIYLVELGNKDQEITYPELFETKEEQKLSFAELNQILEAGEQSTHHVSGTIYVLVYNASKDCSSIKEYVNDAIEVCDENGVHGNDAFYIVNTLSEENKDSSINSFSNLSNLANGDKAYLLVISPENGEYEIIDTFTTTREINQTLITFAEGIKE